MRTSLHFSGQRSLAVSCCRGGTEMPLSACWVGYWEVNRRLEQLFDFRLQFAPTYMISDVYVLVQTALHAVWSCSSLDQCSVEGSVWTVSPLIQSLKAVHDFAEDCEHFHTRKLSVHFLCICSLATTLPWQPLVVAVRWGFHLIHKISYLNLYYYNNYYLTPKWAPCRKEKPPEFPMLLLWLFSHDVHSM